MRKKSHISLALYLSKNIDCELIKQHKKAFIVGNVLPDCKISFVTERHSIEETFDKVTNFVSELTIDSYEYKRISTAYFTKLGELTHYIADYFTYPHNSIFDGSIKDHCVYEGDLKRALVRYIKSGKLSINSSIAQTFNTPEDLCEYLIKMHGEYLESDKSIESDCMYIVELSQIVVEGVLHLLENYMELEEKFSVSAA